MIDSSESRYSPNEMAEGEGVEPQIEGDFEAAKGIRDRGYALMAKEHGRGGRDPKAYHNPDHLRALDWRAEVMSKIFGISSPERLARISMGIAWHDSVIAYDSADPANILSTIRRHRGAREGDKPNGDQGNEALSAVQVVAEMKRVNEEADKTVFSEEDIETTVWAIHATYPDAILGSDFAGVSFKEYPYFDFEEMKKENPSLVKLVDELAADGIVKGPLFTQPHLEQALERGEQVPREVLIVAMSDLAASGMGGAQEFFREGDAEMRELFPNLSRSEVMNRLLNGEEEADRVDREKVSEKFMSWLGNQMGFGVWQAIRFEKIMHLLTKNGGIS